MTYNVLKNKKFIIISKIIFTFIFLFFAVFSSYVRIKTGSKLTGINWDTAILTDGAWRVFNGQKPHADFSTPLGPVTFVFIAAVMKFTNNFTVEALDYASIFIFWIYSITAFFVLRKITDLKTTFIFLLFTSSYLITPRMFNYEAVNFGYTGLYNIWCYPFLFLITLGLFYEGKSGRTEDKTVYFSIGFISAGLLFLKITFGISAIILILFKFIFFKTSFRAKKFALIGAVIGAIILIIYLNFNIIAIFRDLLIVSISRKSENDLGPFRMTNILSLIKVDLLYFLLAFTIPFTIKKIQGVKIEFRKYFFQALTLILIIFVCVFITISITQPPEFALLTIIPFILLGSNYANYRKPGFSNLIINALLWIFVIIYIFPVFQKNITGILEMAKKLNDPIQNQRFYGSHLTVEVYNDGIAHLEKRISPHDHIMMIDFPNMLSMYLNLTPPKNDLLFWHYGVTFNEVTVKNFDYFKPENLFSDTTILMIPKNEARTLTNSHFQGYYRDYIQREFDMLMETPCWKIYFNKKRLILNLNQTLLQPK